MDPNEARRIRLERFAMAAGTYGIVILAAFLVSRLGLGTLTAMEWALFVGAAVVANAVFLALFLSGANLRFSDPSLTWVQILASTVWGMMPIAILPSARPLILMFYLMAFSFGMLQFDRRKYFRLLAIVLALYGSLLGVEYAMARPGFRPEYEITVFFLFGLALTWFTYFGGFVSSLRRRLHNQNFAIRQVNDALREEIAQRTRTAEYNEQLLAELRESLANVKLLSGLLPICASCKKIRDDRGYWQQIESYLHEHSEAVFTHGICPDCTARLYPEFANEDKPK